MTSKRRIKKDVKRGDKILLSKNEKVRIVQSSYDSSLPSGSRAKVVKLKEDLKGLDQTVYYICAGYLKF
jgi:hypothetical protein